MIDIGVRLLGAESETWVMLPAQHVSLNIYCIVDHDVEEAEGCELEFKPGNLVTGVPWSASDGSEFLAARRLYGMP